MSQKSVSRKSLVFSAWTFRSLLATFSTHGADICVTATMLLLTAMTFSKLGDDVSLRGDETFTHGDDISPLGDDVSEAIATLFACSFTRRSTRLTSVMKFGAIWL